MVQKLIDRCQTSDRVTAEFGFYYQLNSSSCILHKHYSLIF